MNKTVNLRQNIGYRAKNEIIEYRTDNEIELKSENDMKTGIRDRIVDRKVATIET